MPSSSPPPATTLCVDHLRYCFDVLDAKLNGKDGPVGQIPHADESFPLFVTWNTVSSTGSSRLRGCIGTFEAQPLQQGLEEYALISALKDRRFSPISIAELPKLECCVSLLTAFEECKDYLDWELGVHGIYIDFDPPGSGSHRSKGATRGSLSATYLPDVAPAQGWSKEEAIDSAIEKAGYHGRVTKELRQSIHVQRYRSEKAGMRYVEWHAGRKNS